MKTYGVGVHWKCTGEMQRKMLCGYYLLSGALGDVIQITLFINLFLCWHLSFSMTI